MNNEAIMKLLNDRDERALEEIQKEYGYMLKSIAFSLYKSDGVAEECLNDALMDIWNTIPPEKPKSVISYACMIIRRRAIDRVKRETAKKRLIPEGSEYTDVMEDMAFVEDIGPDVVDKMQVADIVNRFLGKLSRTNREIFISRYYDFESLDSIAARLNMSKNSVNARLSRLKQTLRCDLEEGGIAL